MSIAEVRGKCKSLLERIPRDILVVAILIAASALSFGLGYMAGRDARPASAITIDIPTPDFKNEGAGGNSFGQVMASRNGSKYYYSSCAGAERISDANKIWFASAAAAERAGYSRAANCK